MNKTPITYRQEKSHMGSMERSFTDQSTLQEDERMALSFMDAHTCGTRGKKNWLSLSGDHGPTSRKVAQMAPDSGDFTFQVEFLCIIGDSQWELEGR